MEQTEISWESGTRGVGLVVSDAMMFQRGAEPSDEHLGSFYGLAMPLVKHGMPVEPVQLENAPITAGLGPYKVLLMTYEGMKPMKPEVHKVLADWVKRRVPGVPRRRPRPLQRRQGVVERPRRTRLSRRPGRASSRPSASAATARPSARKIDKGMLIWDAASPAALSYKAEGAPHVRKLVEQACQAVGAPYGETDHLILHRGPYVIAAGLEADAPEPATRSRGGSSTCSTPTSRSSNRCR